jgi:ABC-type multidrug transport system, permease component
MPQARLSLSHYARALRAVLGREWLRFLLQPSRLGSALVRPLLWFMVFAAGFQNVFGVAVQPPYDTYIEYREYLLPGLLAMIALFNGMQGSLSMVYDREMGMMRLLLTAPLPRRWLLFCKLLATAGLSLLQMLAFLLIAWLFDIRLQLTNLPLTVATMALIALQLAAIDLVLSVYVRQLENFAGTMNFVIFPMFFISSALYPLWKLQEAGAVVLERLAQLNPFTHAVEQLRYALHGQWLGASVLVILLTTALCFGLALHGYDPQRSWVRAARDA